MSSDSVVFGGIAAGFLMGLISVAAFGLIALSIGARRPHVLTSLPRGVSPTLVATCLVQLQLALWTVVIGPSFAILYGRLFAVQWPAGGLGSPNLAYTITVLVLSPFLGLGVLLIDRYAVTAALLVMVTFAAIFGWLLPLLVR